MYADTHAIAAFGLAGADIGDGIGHAASRLAAMPVATVTASFGPVGARFATALAGALEQLATQAAVLAGDVRGGAGSTVGAARAYADTDRRAGAAVARVGT